MHVIVSHHHSITHMEVGWMDEINALISDGEEVDFTIQIFSS